MASIKITLTHTFDNGESSTQSTETGSLGASEAAAMEQHFVRTVAEGQLRLGAYNATQRDPNFPAVMAAVAAIMSGKSPEA